MLAAIGSGEVLPKPFAIDISMLMIMMMVIVIVLKAREDARSDWIW